MAGKFLRKDEGYSFCLWKTLLYWSIVLAISGLCLYVFLHDPHRYRVTVCLFHAVTGLDCPGCGMTRAAYCLMHGQFREAFAYHPFVYLLPLFGYFVLAELSPNLFFGYRLPRMKLPLWLLYALGALLLLYSVGRNAVKFL